MDSASILRWIAVVIGAAFATGLVGSLVRRFLPVRRVRRPSPGLFVAARLVEALGVVAAIALVFIDNFWTKVGLAVCLGATFAARVGLELRERGQVSDPLADLIAEGETIARRPGDRAAHFQRWNDRVEHAVDAVAGGRYAYLYRASSSKSRNVSNPLAIQAAA
ncbi:MAG TPA: hypothetical protein VFU64_04200 [Gaiellaceae bacterium]|nr:hypothetical protein [Gaiellaceae bacterium]